MANFPSGNFIPEVWAKELQVAYEHKSVLPAIANRTFEGQVKRAGDTVHILTVDNLTLGSYSKNATISWSDLSDNKVDLTVDQQKYVAFKIDDIDQAQFYIKDLLQRYGEKGAYAITDDMESYCFGLHANATSKIGSTTTSTTVGYDSGETSPMAILAEAMRKLDVLDVPDKNRFAVFPPHFFEKAMDESGKFIEADAMGDSSSSAKNGFVRHMMGFDLYKSNNLSTGTDGSSNAYYACILGSKEAIALAQQLTKKEMIRLETTFGTGMRLLNVYGAKVVRADALCTAYLHFA